MTIIFICLVSLLISSLHLHTYLAFLIAPLNEFCLHSIPQDSWTPFDQALLCGGSMSSSDLKSLLIETSIYHIVVVSSAHLIFLKSTLKPLIPRTLPEPIGTFIILFVLVTYSLMTSLQPPILRALETILLASISKNLKLHWRPHQILLYSTILTLGINPNLIQSISLQLSFMTGLGLAIEISTKEFFKNALIRSLIIYFLLLPILCHLLTPHPIGILINSFIAPIISFFLLPFSFLSLTGTFLRGIYLSFLEVFFFFLKALSPNYPSPGLPKSYPYQMMWIYCLCCWTLYSILYFLRKRKSLS